jgi:uncharacterized NAD(P)/FAD-binding protein YdhS
VKRRRVAIIGAGFSGVAVAASLLKRPRHAPDIVLIERRARFGPGFAYSTKDPSHLLNVRASNMSAYAEAPDHFARWLAARGKRDASTFVPRGLYGRYVEDVLRRARRGLFGSGVVRMRGAVLACRPDGDGWSLALSSGAKVDADAVVLALGNGAPATPSVFSDAGVTLADPWDVRALRALPAGDVLLLGAGLTMVDVALQLAGWRKKGAIYALSRRGLAPRSHLQSPAPAKPAALEIPAPLSEAVHAFRAELAAMAARGEPWQHGVDRLRARTPELWRRLPLEAQRRFLRHLRPWWDVHRHRAAPEIAARIKALQDAGRLRVLAGDVVAAAPQGKKLDVYHRQRGSLVRHRLELAGVVNCTGASLDQTSSQEPLVRQLLDEGIARAHANGLGFDVDADGRLAATSGSTHQSLFALGPLTQGAFWESTAVPEIRVRAAAIAMMLAPDA